ncbi:putative signal peptidase I [Helianthus annuus]|uniref:Signal peptidase complex catalytic subunit SEC11 n=1 Tax=Helianthus annuus TaxID=4232 RepID=A0A251VTD3_HELAN|nr:signal peptidase complex catalytic subunit SEC11A [Helianthus annuus]KAF5761913.1 putative signal peptidase I [Helianthus annuus]
MEFSPKLIDTIKSFHFRKSITQLVTVGMVIASALMLWIGLMCITGSEAPIVVVLSGSMEPGFKRGDILFMRMSKDPIRVGDILSFTVDGHEIPIVHRAIKVHEYQNTGEVDVLTKGDNNSYGDDMFLYTQGQMWLKRHHITGKAIGFLPYVGWATILLTEKPLVKYILIGSLGLLVVFSKE